MSFEKRYTQSLKEIQNSTPAPDVLASTRSEFAQGIAEVKPRRLGVKLGGLAALAATATLAAFLLTPTKADALDAMQMALRSVPATHTTYFDGKGRVHMEFWNEGVKRRYKTAFDRQATNEVTGSRYIFDRGFDGKSVWEWMDGPKVAIISDEKPDGFGMDSPSIEDSLKVMKTYSKNLTVTSTADTVTIEGEDGQKNPFRQIYRCEDGKPVSANIYVKKKGEWALNASMTVEYPTDIPDSMFEFNPPKDYVVCDHRMAKKAIFDAIAGGGQTQTVQGVQIRLIGAFHEPDGEVTVMWTGGANPHVDGLAGVEGMKASSYGSLRTDVSALYAHHQSMEDRAAAMRAAKTNVPFGADETRPLETGPFFMMGDTPVYAIRARVPYGPKTLRVRIPVFKEGEVRIKQAGDRGAFFSSTGLPVGVAEFEAPVFTVDSVHRFITLGGLNGPRSTGSLPLLPAE